MGRAVIQELFDIVVGLQGAALGLCGKAVQCVGHGVVYGSRVVEEGSIDLFKAFAVGPGERGGCINICHLRCPGSIHWSHIPGRRVLGFRRVFVLELEESLFDVPWHGCSELPLEVVPLEGDADEFGA